MNTIVPEALHPFLADAALAAGLVVLLLLARVPRLHSKVADVALLVFAASAFGAVASMDVLPGWVVRRMIVVDPFGTFFKFVLSMCAMGEVWLSTRSHAEPKGTAAWSPAALAASLLGMFVMVTAVNVVAAWIGFEVVSISCTLWIAARHASPGATDEAVGSLLQGIAASATALFGFALLFGLAGTLEYAGLAAKLPLALAMPGGRGVLYTGLVLVLAGVAYRIAVVAWQPWRADLSERAPLPVSAWLETAGTIAVLAMVARFLRMTFVTSVVDGRWLATIDWPHVVSVAAMVTMTMGNLAAVRATNLKRLVAWLSVAQSGYLMMGLATASDHGIAAMLVHSVVYALMMIGAMTTLVAVVERSEIVRPHERSEIVRRDERSEIVRRDERSDHARGDHADGTAEIDVLRGLARQPGSARVVAAAMMVFFLSLAAVPPLAGFTGKAGLFAAVFEANDLLLAAMAGFNSLLGLVCSVRVIAMLLEWRSSGGHDANQDAVRARTLGLDPDAALLVGLMLAGTIGIGVWPAALASFASRSVVFFGG